MASYRGEVLIEDGVDVVNVTGLNLPFTPSGITVSVNKPGSNSENISGVAIRTTLSPDGFSVELSSPTATPGYALAFYLWDEPTQINVDDALTVDLGTLIRHVSHFLGWDAGDLSIDQVERVDDIIQSGVRQFYFPPIVGGNQNQPHSWSFLKQTGTLKTVSGTDAYELPRHLGRITSKILVAGTVRAIPVVSEYVVLSQNLSGFSGVPMMAAVRSSNNIGEHGQIKEIVLAPIPNAEYDLTYKFDCYTGRITPQNPIPAGGARYSELVIESCLAIAEQRENDEEGIHTKRFQELLVTAVAEDSRDGAQNFGTLYEDIAFKTSPGRRIPRSDGTITYKGVTWP